MTRFTMFLLLLLTGTVSLKAQDKFFTKTGRISFYSVAPLEDIEAHHRSVTAILDSKAGTLQFMLLVNGFEFEKELMQEDFNADYLETPKFPKSEFKGQILNNTAINYTKDGEYQAKVKGTLLLHGELKDMEASGKLTVRGGKIVMNATFNILLSDFKIPISKLVKDKISNKVKITMDATLEPLKS